MPNLLELNSFSRYRLFLGLGGGLLVAVSAARYLTGDLEHYATRLTAALAACAYALFAPHIGVVARNYHAFAVLSVLPLTIHMAVMTFAANLSYDIAIANMVILLLLCACFDVRRWLNMQVAIWCAAVITPAWAVEYPVMSPLTYTILMVVMAVVVGMLIINFYEAQALLSRKMQELDESQEFARVGTWEFDLRTMAASWSKTTHSIIGTDVTSGPESLDQLLADTPANEEFACQIRQFFEGADTYDAVGQVITGDGGLIWVHSRGTTFYEQGKPVRKFGVFLNISDQVEREQALEEARRVAESATAARTQFLANMSHEIRTPMNGVIGMTSLLQREPLSPAAAEQVGIIQSCGEALLATINNILDFTKLDAGKVALEDGAFDLAEVIEASAQIVRKAIEDKGLQLSIVVDMPRLYLLGDALRLKQVLINLLSNASKFTGEGAITVRARVLGVPAETCRFRIEVADTGIGISADAQERLFSPFEQADSSTTREYGGTGLGLAISRKFVEQMQGQISVQSTPGAGSTFAIEMALPVTDAPVARDLAPVSNAIPSHLKILLAEDNRVNQLVATRMLQKIGLRATVVGNGREAVQRAADGHFDLVLMDLQMPIMGGIEATRAIRSRKDLRQPRIVALTANVLLEDRRRCLQAGMDGFLTKPITVEDLQAIIVAQQNHAPSLSSVSASTQQHSG